MKPEIFRHPELREGEAYVSDIFPSTFPKVGWKTKRLGDVAYDMLSGQPMPECLGRKPLFAQRSEMVAAGVNPDIPLDLQLRAILQAAKAKN